MIVMLIVAAAVAQQQAICPKCGFANPTTNKFCNKCGASLRSGTAPTARDETQPIVIQIDSNRVMLSTGRQHGTFVGKRFEVQGLDSLVKNPVTGEVLDSIYKTIAQLVVIQVESKYSFAAIESIDVRHQVTVGSRVVPSQGVHFAVLSDVSFITVPSGEFLMGSLGGEDDERPPHEVQVSKFYLSATEVTQTQWNSVMEYNPSERKGSDLPVESVAYDEVQKFLTRLNTKAGDYAFRLPTEAEWEYACRAGSTAEYCFGDEDVELGRYAWYDANSGGDTHPVGKLLPNAWGLYDMHGNVAEWCADFYDPKAYSNAAGQENKPHPYNPKVVRGGSCDDDASFLRSSSRWYLEPGLGLFRLRGHVRNVGFRVVAQRR
jgi:formylglycine-generating enzyme required for sulfatase activity/ribosomal protein L40E